MLALFAMGLSPVLQVPLPHLERPDEAYITYWGGVYHARTCVYMNIVSLILLVILLYLCFSSSLLSLEFPLYPVYTEDNKDYLIWFDYTPSTALMWPSVLSSRQDPAHWVGVGWGLTLSRPSSLAGEKWGNSSPVNCKSMILESSAKPSLVINVIHTYFNENSKT